LLYFLYAFCIIVFVASFLAGDIAFAGDSLNNRLSCDLDLAGVNSKLSLYDDVLKLMAGKLID